VPLTRKAPRGQLLTTPRGSWPDCRRRQTLRLRYSQKIPPDCARYFDQIFAKQSAHLSKVRLHSKEYLSDKYDPMLYMFSGPDFLYATLFFPNAATYVLAGLEPVGQIPDLTSLRRWAELFSRRKHHAL
jgi:hypothetical protein